jgi:hypothetical protein
MPHLLRNFIVDSRALFQDSTIKRPGFRTSLFQTGTII